MVQWISLKAKQKVVALPAPTAGVVDEEAEAVRDVPSSEGYSATEPFDDSDMKGMQDVVVQAWEDAGLEHCSDSGGAISPGMMAPITPQDENQSDHDGDVEIPVQAHAEQSHKHPSSSPLSSEGLKSQKMDDDPIPTPKVKAARTEGNINQVMDIEMHHNDEEMYPDEWTEDFSGPDSEDEYIAGQAEGEGPPEVSQEKLQQLEQQAALDELEKLHQMNVIEPVTLTPEQAATENTVDTTLVYDWRFRGNKWIRRCRVVAREFKTSATDEHNFSPTSAFSPVRMILTFAAIYNLAVTCLDIKDAFLVVPQEEVLYVQIPEWVRERTNKTHTHWLLRRCLPGQRNAALRWHQYFGNLCEQAGPVSFPGTPTVLRHRDIKRQLYANVHVDDILLVCKPEDVKWFQETVGAGLTMKTYGDVSEETYHDEKRRNSHSTKCDVCAETCIHDEGECKETKGTSISCNLGSLQC